MAEGPAPLTDGYAATYPPENGSPGNGATESIATHPTNPDVVYVTTVNGGIWRTDNARAVSPSWTPLTDSLPSLSVWPLALDRNDPNVVIAATGRWSSYYNDGGSQGQVLVSRDGGSSWSVLTDPLFEDEKLSSVVIRGSTLLAGSVDSVGLVRSTNGGASWTRISGTPGLGLPEGRVDDLVEDRQNPSRLYLTSSGVGVFRSDDLGATWVNVSVNDPGTGGLDDTIRTLATAALMSTANDGTAYIAIPVPVPNSDDRVGLVAYTRNGGASWTRMDAPGVFARGLLHFSMVADPTDSDLVYVAGVDDWMRGDSSISPGGSTPQWARFDREGTPNNTKPHPDSRDMEFDANHDLIEVDDGGTFRRPSPQASADWLSMSGNMSAVEFHAIAYDANSRVIFGGTQDNGTLLQNTPGSQPWRMIFPGDGGDVAVDTQSNPGFSIRYYSFQGLGWFSRTTFDANNVEVSHEYPLLFVPGEGQCVNDDPPQGCEPAFYTAIQLNRADPSRIVLAMADAIYESFDRADNLTSLGIGGYVGSMAYGHSGNPDVLYAANWDRVLVRLAANAPLAPTPTPYPSVEARGVVMDGNDFRTAYVIGSYNVLVASGGGTSWQDVTGNLPSLQPGILRFVQFVPGTFQDLVVVGADRGVFASSTSALGTWQEVGDLPNAPVLDMQYDQAQDVLVAGLLGRGAWSVRGLGTAGGGTNQAPVAVCRDAANEADASCTASVSSAAVDAGSFDPDGDSFSCELVPAGPFGVGTSAVTLSCTDSRGATSTCSAKVHIGVGNSAACCPAGTHVIVGTPNDDVINGTAGSDCILGLGGQDTISGLGGADFISGGDGNDVLRGGGGDDFVFGGSGQDRLYGDAGNDVLSGGDSDDECHGGDGLDTLLGGQGQDRLYGDAGNDQLVGNEGDDRLEGGAGDDVLDGSGLHDVCIGGTGTDSFLICETQVQ